MYKFSTRRSTITIGSKGINTKNKHLEIKDKYYSRKSVCVHGQPVRERATKHERNMNYQTMLVVDGIKYIHLEFVMLYHLNHEVTLENLIAYPDMRINQLNKEAKDNINFFMSAGAQPSQIAQLINDSNLYRRATNPKDKSNMKNLHPHLWKK